MASWVEIDKQQLAENFRILKAETAHAAGVNEAPTLLAVVKADAYGHGARICAPVLAQAGASWLGVTDAAEGAVIRAALLESGVAIEQQPRVLVMCGMLPGDAATILSHQLTPVIWTQAHLKSLATAAGEGNALPVHLEIDTGMGRQGVAVGPRLDAMIAALQAEPRLKLEGVMTHIASSEVGRSEQTRRQHLLFESALGQLRAAGLPVPWVHVGSTSTVDSDDRDGPRTEHSIAWIERVAATCGARAMIRTGLGLYGYCLPVTGAGIAQVRSELRPIMTWKTRVIDLRDVRAGDTIGYNGTFVAAQAMRLALLPVGYADGMRRELSSTSTQPGGWVMIAGTRCNVIGRISMNLLMADVTAVKDVNVGDVATLLGDGVTADDHARLAGTIAYEILCGVKAAHCPCSHE